MVGLTKRFQLNGEANATGSNHIGNLESVESDWVAKLLDDMTYLARSKLRFYLATSSRTNHGPRSVDYRGHARFSYLHSELIALLHTWVEYLLTSSRWYGTYRLKDYIPRVTSDVKQVQTATKLGRGGDAPRND